MVRLFSVNGSCSNLELAADVLALVGIAVDLDERSVGLEETLGIVHYRKVSMMMMMTSRIMMMMEAHSTRGKELKVNHKTHSLTVISTHKYIASTLL